jgi:hypothetical protein
MVEPESMLSFLRSVKLLIQLEIRNNCLNSERSLPLFPFIERIKQPVVAVETCKCFQLIHSSVICQTTGPHETEYSPGRIKENLILKRYMALFFYNGQYNCKEYKIKI